LFWEKFRYNLETKILHLSYLSREGFLTKLQESILVGLTKAGYKQELNEYTFSLIISFLNSNINKRRTNLSFQEFIDVYELLGLHESWIKLSKKILFYTDSITF